MEHFKKEGGVRKEISKKWIDESQCKEVVVYNFFECFKSLIERDRWINMNVTQI